MLGSDEIKEKAGFIDVLRNRDFRALWLGQVISQVGDSFSFLALLIMVDRLTGSTVAMGMMMISLALPQLLFGLLAGVFVDRFDRKRIMIVSDILRGFLVLLFLSVQRADQVPIYYLVGFMVSTVSIFFLPAKNATIPNIVEEEMLLSANALSETTRVLAMLVGPALAGLLIGWRGSSFAFIFDSLSFFLSALAIIFMRVPRTALDRGRMGVGLIRRRLQEGFSFILQNATVWGIMVSAGVAMLGVGAVNVLFVPFLQGEMGVGPEGIGFVDTTQALGMVLGSVVIGNIAARIRPTRIISMGLLMLGVCISALRWVPGYLYVLLSVFVFGVSWAPAQAALNTLLQVVVPDDKRGRVNSALGTFTTISNLVSMGVAASLAELLGIRQVFFICGLLGLGAGLLALLVMKDPAEMPVRASLGIREPR